MNVGYLGRLKFCPRIYMYTGSARGKGPSGLKGRIFRHFRVSKKRRWHIDYLASSTSIIEVIFSATDMNLECAVHKALLASLRDSLAIRGFGSSDCREGCGGHLIYLGHMDLSVVISAVTETYHYLKLYAGMLSDTDSFSSS